MSTEIKRNITFEFLQDNHERIRISSEMRQYNNSTPIDYNNRTLVYGVFEQFKKKHTGKLLKIEVYEETHKPTSFVNSYKSSESELSSILELYLDSNISECIFVNPFEIIVETV